MNELPSDPYAGSRGCLPQGLYIVLVLVAIAAFVELAARWGTP